MLGTFTCVGSGTSWRYTPYHIRHRTEVAGFMTILHGDDRFYNNIFVQAYPVDAPAKQGDPGENERVVGTWCFDDYPTEQEWLDQFDLDVARPDMGKLEKYHFGHLPVWADGNAYFAGAKPWKKEKDCCVKSEKPYFMLVEREGQIFLDTDVAELIGAFRGGLVDSDTLGRAFVYSTPEYAIMKLPFQCLQAGVGAVTSWILCCPLGLTRRFRSIVK